MKYNLTDKADSDVTERPRGSGWELERNWKLLCSTLKGKKIHLELSRLFSIDFADSANCQINLIYQIIFTSRSWLRTFSPPVLRSSLVINCIPNRRTRGSNTNKEHYQNWLSFALEREYLYKSSIEGENACYEWTNYNLNIPVRKNSKW